MKLTILSDNKVLTPKGYKAEWGFSVLIEGKETILFDSGQNVAFENLIAMNKPLPSKIVLSHGHYDHTTGLRQFLGNVKIYAHPDALLPRYFEGRYIGIPYRKDLIAHGNELIEHTEPIEVAKNVFALGEIPRSYETALLKDSFLIRGNEKERDEIRDDQAIAIKTEKGVALILGCCHSGFRNTFEWAEEVMNDEIFAIIGGTHFIAYDEQKIVEILRKIDVEFIAPTHCTGLKAEMIIARELGEKYRPVGVGSEFEL